jgi:Terminase small subunit
MAKPTRKQQRFVDEYLIDLNATQAAIRARLALVRLVGRSQSEFWPPHGKSRLGCSYSSVEWRSLHRADKVIFTPYRVRCALNNVSHVNGAEGGDFLPAQRSPETQPPSSPQRLGGQERSSATVRDPRVGGSAKTTSKPIAPLVAAAPGRLTAAPIPSGATRQEEVQLSPQAVTARPVVPQPTQEMPSPPAAAPSAADIAPAVEAYARAIESRDVGTIRRINPGLTSDQQRVFEQFFQAARSINVTFRVANVEASGTSVNARLVGGYEYVTTEGRSERQPVNFVATLRHDGNVWRLVSVR